MTETWRNSYNSLIVPCDCGCTHAVFSYWEYEEDDPEIDLTFYTYSDSPGFWHRLKMAWLMIFRKEHWLHCLLIHKNDVTRLRDFLDRFDKKGGE